MPEVQHLQIIFAHVKPLYIPIYISNLCEDNMSSKSIAFNNNTVYYYFKCILKSKIHRQFY